MIRELDAAGLPVILVLTKVDWTKNPITGTRGAEGIEEFVDWLENPVDEERAARSTSRSSASS